MVNNQCDIALCFKLILGSLSKPRRRQQRERHQTKGLMTETIPVHVHYKSLYISVPSSAKQRREMTRFRVDYETWTTQAKFSHIYLELNAVAANVAVAGFWSHWRTEQI